MWYRFFCRSLPTFLTILRSYWVRPMSLSSQTPFISLPFLKALSFPNLLFLLFQTSPSEEAKFEPDFYWGHTVFKSSRYNTLYLGCDENKMATLVHMKITDYPNPQAMFIVNEFNVVLLPDCNWSRTFTWKACRMITMTRTLLSVILEVTSVNK